MEKELNLYEKLSDIQVNLNAPKNQFNEFGNYSYRNAEDVLSAIKPFLKKHSLILLLTDDIEVIGERYYIVAHAILKDSNGNEIIVKGRAREPLIRKKMDDAQITGATSSYARKYALNGLFAIDDNKDADYLNDGSEANTKAKTGTRKQNTNAKANNNSNIDFNPEDNDYKRKLWGQLRKHFNNEDANKRLNQIAKNLGYTDVNDIKKSDEEKIDKIINSLVDQMNSNA